MKNWLYAVSVCLNLVNIFIFPIPSVWLIVFTTTSVFILGLDVTTRFSDVMTVLAQTKKAPHTVDQTKKITQKTKVGHQRDDVLGMNRLSVGLTTQYNNSGTLCEEEAQQRQVVELEDNESATPRLQREFTSLTLGEQQALMRFCLSKNPKNRNS